MNLQLWARDENFMNALVYLNAYRWKYIILDYTGGRETENMYIFQDDLLIESIKSPIFMPLEEVGLGKL